ncbi:MAG: prolipoprotein diacylglyceryl transferase [Actinomycetota bacterium]
MELASFPSPSISALNLGPLTIHFYALCIIAGIIVAVWWGERRFIALGGAPGVVTDVAYWAVPSGIVGGRLYHLATSWNSERTFLDAIAIWRGGLGIWGAIGLGAGGAYLRYRMLRRKGSLHGVELQSLPSFATFMDALAPGIVIAQAIGRWGNWFNVELFGRPSSLPWALQVPVNKRPNGFGDFETFHPTFLYESLWCIVVALLLIGVAGKGFLRSGGIFLLYVASYSFGRFWIENLRIDTSEEIFGLRFNVWVSLCAFIFAALATFRRRNRPMSR